MHPHYLYRSIGVYIFIYMIAALATTAVAYIRSSKASPMLPARGACRAFINSPAHCCVQHSRIKYASAIITRMSSDTATSNSNSSSGGRASAAVLKDSGARTGKGNAQQEKMDLNPVKGTRDMYPEDMRLRNWLFNKWRVTAAAFGFEEYDAPVLESEALYTRKSGEEVTQQLYNFEDKGNRRVALRPEMTPSLARMVMARRNGVALPLKWFSIPQCWRYERMTRGRRREHYQWNMDIWGIKGVEAEAELLSSIVAFFESVGLTSKDIGIRVNSRAVLSEVMTRLGVPADKHSATCVLVDKLEKVPLSALKEDLVALDLSEDIVNALLETMKSSTIHTLKETLQNQNIENSSEESQSSDLLKLFDLGEAYGYKDWLVYDPSLVRGLAYYTGIVFEGFDRSGALRAICGGGRYDKLLNSFGGESIPACGFGFGDAVIVELLNDKKLLPASVTSSNSGGAETVVYAFDASLQLHATTVATSIRKSGRTVDLILEDRRAKWVFKHADRRGSRFVCVVGPDEWANGEVNVKDLTTGTQVKVKIDNIADHIASVVDTPIEEKS